MKNFKFSFTGRAITGIPGKTYLIQRTEQAETQAIAEAQLLEEFAEISNLKLLKVF